MKKLESFSKRKIFCVFIFSIFLNSCDSKISLNIVRPPIHKIDNIDFIVRINNKYIIKKDNVINNAI